MKVSLFHAERRTAQTIQFEHHPENPKSLPKRLLPTHRTEFELTPGQSVEFNVSVGGKKVGPPVQLFIALELQSGDLMREGWLIFDGEKEAHQVPSREELLTAIESGGGVQWNFVVPLSMREPTQVILMNWARESVPPAAPAGDNEDPAGADAPDSTAAEDADGSQAGGANG